LKFFDKEKYPRQKKGGPFWPFEAPNGIDTIVFNPYLILNIA
jgi:hypothetical protein